MIVLRRRDLFSETYCGGYSGEDPPLPIPNREVKLTIADGTAPPGGRVGSCHALTKSFETKVSELFLCVAVCPTQRDRDKTSCRASYCTVSEGKIFLPFSDTVSL